MNRNGFFLGVFATGAQVLLLRELEASLHGDELFIGVALFGWLVWGGVGAVHGGKVRTRIHPSYLFLIGALLAPAMIVVTRLSPLAAGMLGEPISFSWAAGLSLLLCGPCALLGGWIFAVLVQEGRHESHGMLGVYFSEGVGAFAVGLAISLGSAVHIATLAMAFAVSWGVVLSRAPWKQMSVSSRIIVILALMVTVSSSVIVLAPAIDRSIEKRKYRPYEIEASLDTPYSHQTVLERRGIHTLLTDGRIEAVESEVQSAENMLLPPLAYLPSGKRVLLVGQGDIGLGDLAEQLPNITLDCVDPRQRVRDQITKLELRSPAVTYQSADPLSYLQAIPDATYDIVVLPLDETGSYRSTRILSERVLVTVKRVLRPHGVLQVITPYDTDRYLSDEMARILGVIRNTIGGTFVRTIIWPGTNTLFLAGDSSLVDLPADSIAARLALLPYKPQFLNENYLPDRLNRDKVQRLAVAIGSITEQNSIERPILANLQTTYRSRSFSSDRWLAFDLSTWGKQGVGALLLVLLVPFVGLVRGERERSFGLLLYFVAGFCSLTLEVMSFYVYQSTAGALYSDMAVLIGAFMLGLATGTRIAAGVERKGGEWGTLLLLLAVTIWFASTSLTVPSGLALAYHVFFQFAIALCTGALFVAGTRRYYRNHAGNQGLGYGLELMGSSLGALVTLPLLLPTMGLQMVLTLVAGLVALVLFVSLTVSSRRVTG